MDNAKRKTKKTPAEAPARAPIEIDGSDLRITKQTRRTSGGGTWVIGTLQGHRFEALVFPEHAEVSDYELGDSRISKLWLQRLADGREVYCWDRGVDLAPADAAAAAVVDFLAAGLPEHVYGK